jgi:hypothetical protein
MDQTRFDALARSLAASRTRRGLLGSIASLGMGLLGTLAAGAQITQAQCGNKVCASNPAVCTNGCVCCVYPNGNSRCRPPQDCAAPGIVATTTTTPAPCGPFRTRDGTGACVHPCTLTSCPGCFACAATPAGDAICVTNPGGNQCFSEDPCTDDRWCADRGFVGYRCLDMPDGTSCPHGRVCSTFQNCVPD